MTMTKKEIAAKGQIYKYLDEEGYGKYADLLSDYDINLTEDPKVIGYMNPDKGVIVLNSGLLINQVSMVVRHEILHFFFEHMERAKKHLGKDKWDSYTLHLINMAADWEISIRGYTWKDKRTAKSLLLNGKVHKGLVTDIDHKEWVDYTMEQMYDELLKEDPKAQYSIDAESILIGDTGDGEIQDAEQVARVAKAIEEAIEDGKDEKEIEKIKKEAEKLKSKAKEAAKGDKEKGDIFADTDEDTLDEIGSRLKEIKAKLSDISIRNGILDQTASVIDRENTKKQEKEIAKYNKSSKIRFIASLNNFFKREVEPERQSTWNKLSIPYYLMGALHKGRRFDPTPRIPKNTNVYFDVSGSWSPEDTQMGEEAIATLNSYVQRGLVKIYLYYFAYDVSADRDKQKGGGTCGEPILKHIKKTNPDNVIIMTDGDISDCRSDITLRGALWLLWKNGVSSDNLRQHIHGARGTSEFDLIPND